MAPAELPPLGRPPPQRGRPTPRDVAQKPAAGTVTRMSKASGTAGSQAAGQQRVAPRQLWQHCEAVLTGFNPNTHTVDSHTAEYLAKPGCGVLGPPERAFIEQVSYGCSRYKNMLESMVTRYLTVKRRMNDCFTAFVILSYLALFRLGELGIGAFRSLTLGCTSHSRVAEFLQFIFAPGSAERHFAAEWRRYFDDDYVDNVLLGHIAQFSPQMLELAAGFDALAGSQEQRKQEQAEGKMGAVAKPPTRPEPFKLTQVKPRVVPEPEVLSPPARPPRPADAATQETRDAIEAFKHRRIASTLEQSRQNENRRKEEQRPFQPPALRALNDRPAKLPEVKKKVEEERRQEARPEVGTRPAVQEVRKRLARLPTEAPKITAAALLREDAVWRRRDDEAQAALRKKETEMRDDSEFREWQHRMLEEDDARAKAMVAQRKVEMMLADEEARAARRKQERKNAREAAELKERVEDQLLRMREEHARREEENREFAAVQREVLRDNVRKAEAAVSAQKKGEAKAVREEDRMLELKLAETMELELRRKAEIIRSIKEEVEAMKYEVDPETGKRVRKIFKRGFDPESTTGLGTLGEMSLAELQRKLDETRREHAAQREAKNTEITQAIEARRREHGDRLEAVRRRREQQTLEKQALREQRRQERSEEEERQRAREEERLLALESKLRERRDERRREEEQRRERERARVLQQQFKAADKGAREAKNWAEKELGQERIAQRSQREKVANDAVDAGTAKGQAAERERNISTRVAANRRTLAEQKARLKESRALFRAQQELEESSIMKAATAERHRKQEARKLERSDVLDQLDSMTMPYTC